MPRIERDDRARSGAPVGRRSGTRGRMSPLAVAAAPDAVGARRAGCRPVRQVGAAP